MDNIHTSSYVMHHDLLEDMLFNRLNFIKLYIQIVMQKFNYVGVWYSIFWDSETNSDSLKQDKSLITKFFHWTGSYTFWL